MTARQASLPPGWVRAKIEELFAPLNDGRTLHQGWSPQCDDEPAAPGEWGVLKTTAIQAGAFIDEHNKRLPAALEPRPGIEVSVGDILLTCAGPRSRCGVPCLVRRTRSKLMMSGKMYRFRVPAGVNPLFVEGWLLTAQAQAAIDRMKTGGSDSGLNLTHNRFRTLEIPVAPSNEQDRIVEALESYLPCLDAALASLDRVQAKILAYRASVLKAAVEGRLVVPESELAREEKREYEPASILLDRILKVRRRRWEEAELARLKRAGRSPRDEKWKKKYEEPDAPDTRELPELPEGWCWASVGQVGEAVTGTTPTSTNAAYYGDKSAENLAFFKPTDLDAGENVREARQYLTSAGQEHARRLPAGSILVTCIGATVGKVGLARVECATNQQINAWVPEDVLSTSRYGFWFFASPRGREQVIGNASSTTLPILNKGRFLQLAVPIPPAAEQERIVAEVERRVSVSDESEAVVARQKQRIQRLRQAILKWAFEGKLVDQDPHDEPAENLLARIRTEHVTTTSKTKNAKERLAG